MEAFLNDLGESSFALDFIGADFLFRGFLTSTSSSSISSSSSFFGKTDNGDAMDDGGSSIAQVFEVRSTDIAHLSFESDLSSFMTAFLGEESCDNIRLRRTSCRLTQSFPSLLPMK